MKAYCDSSYLVSLYTPDANSRTAARLARRPDTLLLSPLCEIELLNALYLRVFRKQMSETEARASYRALNDDLVAGVYAMQPLSPAVFAAAKRLSAEHTKHLGTRSLDILHIAAALEARVDFLYSLDAKQRKLAAQTELPCLPELRE